MEEETGKATLVGGMAGKQECFHSPRASSTERKYVALVTCVQTPAKFWARLGEGEGSVTRHVTIIVCLPHSQVVEGF